MSARATVDSCAMRFESCAVVMVLPMSTERGYHFLLIGCCWRLKNAMVVVCFCAFGMSGCVVAAGSLSGRSAFAFGLCSLRFWVKLLKVLP